VSLAAWSRLEVGTPVELRIGDAEPFAGNVVSSTRTKIEIIGENRETRWVRWPTARMVTHDEPTQLRWIDDRWRTITLTIREEKP
jgi:hypothetical protein